MEEQNNIIVKDVESKSSNNVTKNLFNYFVFPFVDTIFRNNDDGLSFITNPKIIKSLITHSKYTYLLDYDVLQLPSLKMLISLEMANDEYFNNEEAIIKIFSPFLNKDFSNIKSIIKIFRKRFDYASPEVIWYGPGKIIRNFILGRAFKRVVILDRICLEHLPISLPRISKKNNKCHMRAIHSNSNATMLKRVRQTSLCEESDIKFNGNLCPDNYYNDIDDYSYI